MGRLKKPRFGAPGEPALDALFYNQVLDELRRYQDSGAAYFGSFVYDPKPVAPEFYGQWHAPLLPHAAGKQEGAGGGGGGKGVVSRFGKSPGVDGRGVGWEERAYSLPNGGDGTGKPSAISLAGKSVAGAASPASVQRLGSIEHAAGDRMRFRAETPGVTSSSYSASHIGKEEDFPAAWRAVEFIRRYREKLAESMHDAAWKEVMLNILLEEAPKYKGEEKSGPFSEEEDAMLLVLRYVCGNKWQLAEKILPGRSASGIKKHWHSTLRERYKRAGWCSQLLAPPLHVTLNAKNPTSEDRSANYPNAPNSVEIAGSAGGARQNGEAEEEAESSDGEDGEEADCLKEDERASTHEVAVELEAARPFNDPRTHKRVLHNQYLCHIAACEANCREQQVWEDVCFICKTAAGQVACCMWGRNGIGGEGAILCWKACHPQCLVPTTAQIDSQTWSCPRHQCAAGESCRVVPKYICRGCPKSFCLTHVPTTIKDAGPLHQNMPPNSTSRKIVCPTCQDLERPPSPGNQQMSQEQRPQQQASSAPAQPLPQPNRKSWEQPQQQASPTPSQPMLQSSSASWGLPHRQRLVERKLKRLEQGSSEERAWMASLDGIRWLPTNNGGQTLDRIRQAIDAIQNDDSLNDVRELLEKSVSPAVYRSNSVGPTRNMALNALELYRQTRYVPMAAPV